MGPSRLLRAFSSARKRGSATIMGGAEEEVVEVERIIDGSGVESLGVEM